MKTINMLLSYVNVCNQAVNIYGNLIKTFDHYNTLMCNSIGGYAHTIQGCCSHRPNFGPIYLNIM